MGIESRALYSSQSNIFSDYRYREESGDLHQQNKHSVRYRSPRMMRDSDSSSLLASDDEDLAFLKDDDLFYRRRKRSGTWP